MLGIAAAWATVAGCSSMHGDGGGGGGGGADAAMQVTVDASTHHADASTPPGDSGSDVPIVPAFYVATDGSDSAAGTLDAPFATFARAQTAMRASSTIKTTYVRKGSYTLSNIASCTCGLDLEAADAGETFSYYPPDGVNSADLDAGSTSASTGLVVAVYVAGENITIDGLAIHNFAYAGINSNGGANNLVIKNNDIYNGYYASNNSNPGGISITDAGSATISHNVIHDIAMLGSSVIASSAHPNISGLLVTGNVVYNTCTANADCGGIYVQDVTATQTNLRVTDNYVHDGNTFAQPGSERRRRHLRRRLHVEPDGVGQRGHWPQRQQHAHGPRRQQRALPRQPHRSVDVRWPRRGVPDLGRDRLHQRGDDR